MHGLNDESSELNVVFEREEPGESNITCFIFTLSIVLPTFPLPSGMRGG